MHHASAAVNAVAAVVAGAVLAAAVVLLSRLLDVISDQFPGIHGQHRRDDDSPGDGPGDAEPEP